MPRDDLASIIKALDEIPKEVQAPIRKAIDKGADELVSRMRYLAPEGKTGNLKRSIRKTELGNLAVRVEAGGPLTTKKVRKSEKGNAPEFDYALAVEWGTADATAQPFFVPSVNTLKKRVRRRVDRAIGKAVKAVWEKS